MGPGAILSLLVLLVVAVPALYLFALAIASAFPMRCRRAAGAPRHRFAVTIPAHDEESVIGETVRRLRQLDYPADLFDVHVVADHCSDRTAELARAAGATAHERNDGPRTGKGGALSWLFRRVLADPRYDAVVVFDGDTKVAPDFLRAMDARLAAGDRVIQGQHVISNPRSGWFPALTWAMFLVDNRFSNRGRANLGLAAKNMGDSICLRADVLRRIGWGDGLTEDYQLRQRLLLEGVRIAYEPAAIGRGESVQTWARARAQRARWLRGTHEASKTYARRLLVRGLRERSWLLIDGALQAYFPSYSTLSLVVGAALVGQLLLSAAGAAVDSRLVGAWAVAFALLFAYPLLGLALERAPVRAFVVMLSGPLFVIWRSWLAFHSRFGAREVAWVRTAHGDAAIRQS